MMPKILTNIAIIYIKVFQATEGAKWPIGNDPKIA